MDLRLNRRAVLAGGVSMLALTSLGLTRAMAQETRLRMMWWGTDRRNKLQAQVNALFQERNPGVAVDGESAAFNDYWPRLATQVSGGNAPDIINMDYRYLADYANRGVLLELDSYVGSGLDVADFGLNLDSGRIDGKLYGINTGVNAAVILVNAAAYEEVGLTPPHAGTTWAEYADNAEKLTKTTKRPHFFGANDGSSREPLLEVWLRQRGKALFTADGKLGYDVADAAEWFGMWADMRERQAIPPTDIAALDTDTFETGLINTGYAATNFGYSSNLNGYQALNQEKLTLVPPPMAEGGKPGLYLKPSMLFGVSASSQKADASVAYINFLLKDLDATKIMGLERGVSVSAAVRENLTPGLAESDAATVSFIGSLGPDMLGELPPVPPQGAGEATVVLTRIAQEIGFGGTSPEAGAQQLVDEVTSVLARA